MNRPPDPTDAEVDAMVTADDEAAEAALRDELAEAIWKASRADEGTISATGANIVATALLPVVARHVAKAEARGFERGKRDPWSGWIDGKKAGAAEERERIATAIEAHLSKYGDVMTPNERKGARDAARIARGGGQ